MNYNRKLAHVWLNVNLNHKKIDKKKNVYALAAFLPILGNQARSSAAAMVAVLDFSCKKSPYSFYYYYYVVLVVTMIEKGKEVHEVGKVPSRDRRVKISVGT